jgi:predicted 3-demethylubiquinone-9 3-methyltransferase (glyoxalase superfamily)
MITDTRKEIVMSKVAPHLWFAKDAEEAASVYVSLLPDSRIDSVTTMPADSPSGPPGSVQMVEFTLAGQQFLALAAGPLDPCELYHASYVGGGCSCRVPGGRARGSVTP